MANSRAKKYIHNKMPGRRTSANGLRKQTARAKRKRVANTTRIRFQKPTARNQKSQIMTNARAIRMLKRVVGPPVYCDWQQFGNIRAEVSTGGNFTQTIVAQPLSNFQSWSASMRTDQNVIESSTTFWRNMSINFRYFLNQSDYAQWSMFIVTLRKNSTNRRFQLGLDPLTENIDYIQSPDAMAIRLNPSVFKVHWTRQLAMTENTFYEPAAPGAQMAGNPMTTWKKGQVNIKVGARLRAPTYTSIPEPPGVPTQRWKDMDFTQCAYYNRYYILAFCNQRSLIDNPSSYLSWDMLCTTINDN